VIVLAGFWLAIGLFIALAPGDVLRSDNPRLRTIGATVAFVFAAASLAIAILS
jgi:hypothetical protein